jgi:hypothetical protein
MDDFALGADIQCELIDNISAQKILIKIVSTISSNDNLLTS